MSDKNLLINEVEMKKVGIRLKALRKSKGYRSPDIFAYENNINRSQYGKYEAGAANITIGTLISILNCFNVSLSEFFNEDYESASLSE